ncbi:MAG TPA: hypothetical protein VLE72_00375 [Candidatus Saccharimonadales bacterium]|nr:hypothetical protein [Candidatus Saccharimonadales bacterium]
MKVRNVKLRYFVPIAAIGGLGLAGVTLANHQQSLQTADSVQSEQPRAAPKVHVNVDGQNVFVPENGTTTKTTDDGTTTVTNHQNTSSSGDGSSSNTNDISVDVTSNGSSSTSSRHNVHVSSFGSNSINEDTDIHIQTNSGHVSVTQ